MKIQKWDDEWGEYMTNMDGKLIYPIFDTYENRQWFEHCRQFENFLRNNHRAPRTNTDLKLYQWFNRQKQLLRKGAISGERRDAVNLLYVGDFVYVRKKEVIYPYQDWQIKANNNTYWIINKDFKV